LRGIVAELFDASDLLKELLHGQNCLGVRFGKRTKLGLEGSALADLIPKLDRPHGGLHSRFFFIWGCI